MSGFNKNTCEDGKCKIPCLCAMCNECDNSMSCTEHRYVNFISLGFDPESDMITLRSADTFDLIKTDVEPDLYYSNK